MEFVPIILHRSYFIHNKLYDYRNKRKKKMHKLSLSRQPEGFTRDEQNLSTEFTKVGFVMAFK